MAVGVAMRSGIVIELQWIEAPWLRLTVNAALTALWLIWTTNAANLLDIMDGLAASVGSIAALALLVVAVVNGRGDIASATAALAGAQLGFLRFNRQPGFGLSGRHGGSVHRIHAGSTRGGWAATRW